MISFRYPALELASALVGACALCASPDLPGLSGALFGWQLLALAITDFEHMRLPIAQSVALAFTGLAQAVLVSDTLSDSLIGLATGFAALALVRLAYRKARGREGMGGGDPPMLAGIGAWLGWQMLPITLLLASGAGLIWALLMSRTKGKQTFSDRLPFGTMMAGAAFPCWLWLAWRF